MDFLQSNAHSRISKVLKLNLLSAICSENHSKVLILQHFGLF